jgi:ABC-2 type transport system ATP-binding protein
VLSLPPDPGPALEIAGLSHRFGTTQVLDGVGFTVPRGGFTVLLGPNGAGKTTLFALITRLYQATEGHIVVLGHDLRTEPLAALASIGVAFQQPTLDLDLTVEENLFYHAALHGIGRREARARLVSELDRVGLLDRRRERVRVLSGGQRRRVELARALVQQPRLLLLDEPTAGLDVTSRNFLRDHVRSLCRDAGVGVLWATHLIEEADACGDVVVLHRGRVLAAGPVTRLVQAAGAPDLAGAFASLVAGG